MGGLVVRSGRAAVGAERSPSARGWHAVVEQVGRALAEQALVGDARARLHDAAAHPARARVTRCGRRADDDHRRSQDDFLDAGVEFSAVAPVEVLVVDELLHRRRPIEAGEEGRVRVRVASGSLAVDVSRTRRRQGSVGGLGVPPGIARRARRRRQTPKRIWTPTINRTRMLSGQVVGRRERRLLLFGCSGEPCAVQSAAARDAVTCAHRLTYLSTPTPPTRPIITDKCSPSPSPRLRSAFPRA